jgi:hypothetical protein
MAAGALVATAAVLAPSYAQAQYIQTAGTVTCTTSNSTPQAGGAVTFSVLVLDGQGRTVSGQQVLFAANGAQLASPTGTTNGSGIASVNVTAGQGAATLIATSNSLQCGSLLSPQAPAGPSSEVAGSRFIPPATGDAGLSLESNTAKSGSVPVSAVLGLAVVIGGLGLAGLGLSRRATAL